MNPTKTMIRRRATKLAVALSGGVDSSVAAFLLQSAQKDEVEIIGIHMFNWDTHDEDESSCNASQEKDWNDAKAVAQHLNIPIYPKSFVSEYWTQVFEPFCDELQQAKADSGRNNMRMPNPDIMCNRFIKFGALQNYCQETFGVDTLLATGHYARLWHRDKNCCDDQLSSPLLMFADSNNNDNDNIEAEIEQMLEDDPSLDWIRTWGENNNSKETPLLIAAKDRSKDQSYFLSSGGTSSQTGVPGDAFRNVIFPLGGIFKNVENQEAGKQLAPAIQTQQTVRQIALSSNLPTAMKRESMGICFVGKRRHGFARFMDQYVQYQQEQQQEQHTQDYQFIDIDTGNLVMGDCSHINDNDEKNIARKYFTYGQKAKISGSYQKWFVVSLDPIQQHIIYVCGGTHHPALYCDSLTVKQIHWMTGITPTPLILTGKMRAKCRVRHLQPLMDCTIILQQDNESYQVQFDTPVRAVTPSQQVVFYIGQDGLVCLGGGPILKRGPTYHERNMTL